MNSQTKIDAFVLRMGSHYDEQQIIGAIMLEFNLFYDDALKMYFEAKINIKQ